MTWTQLLICHSCGLMVMTLNPICSNSASGFGLFCEMCLARIPLTASWPCVSCFVRSFMLAACFLFCVTSSSLSSSTRVVSRDTSFCSAVRSSCRPCTSCCRSDSSCFSCRDCTIKNYSIHYFQLFSWTPSQEISLFMDTGSSKTDNS